MAKLSELFDRTEFEDLLMTAEQCANTIWEMDYVDDMKEQFYQYEMTMYLTEEQEEILNRIATCG